MVSNGSPLPGPFSQVLRRPAPMPLPWTGPENALALVFAAPFRRPLKVRQGNGNFLVPDPNTTHALIPAGVRA